jgi:hypothetical protein
MYSLQLMLTREGCSGASAQQVGLAHATDAFRTGFGFSQRINLTQETPSTIM